MPRNTLVYEKRENIVQLTFNRTAAGNPIDLQFVRELEDACREINEDDASRAVIITGAGDAFCTGVDMGTLLSLSTDEARRSNPASLASLAVASINCPVIAAINGDALGAGLEMALACDVRIASDNARFGLPETSYGLIPGGGGTQRLPRIIGRGKATEMILTARSINAEEAFQVGLVSKVVPVDKLANEAESIAGKLASRAPIAVRYAKEAVYKGMDMTLNQGLRLEADLSFLLQTTADRDEGIKAFLEKRTPQFRGE